MDRGRTLYRALGCDSCHVFTGSSETSSRPRDDGPAKRLAPDLRHVRNRMSESAIVAWLLDPTSVDPDALMPQPDTTARDRLDLAAFLLSAPLEPEAVQPAPARLAPLDRPVAYREVEERVFKKVCWHCHSDPEPVGGDGGAGNTGGFGYSGKGIDLSSRDAILRGGTAPDGSRIDLVGAHDSSAPLLVEVMRVRHAELGGTVDPRRLGMPLGLPAMSLEEIQIVESWIAQDCPE